MKNHKHEMSIAKYYTWNGVGLEGASSPYPWSGVLPVDPAGGSALRPPSPPCGSPNSGPGGSANDTAHAATLNRCQYRRTCLMTIMSGVGLYMYRSGC